jgi:hypothetical protein
MCFKNQTLKLKREISSHHFDVTELALHARLQERFPKGTCNQMTNSGVRRKYPMMASRLLRTAP